MGAISPITGVTEKQEAYIQKYLELQGNGTQAIIYAFGTKNPRTAATMSTELLKNPNVIARLDEINRGKEKTKEQKVNRIIEELESIGLIEADGVLIKVTDKLKALELLGKNLAMFTDKVQTEGTQVINVIHNVPRPAIDQSQESTEVKALKSPETHDN